MSAVPDIHALIEQLFRRESGKVIAVLTRIFGSDYLELAEDVVHDAFASAVERWAVDGIPEKPAAWIYRVAKNKALNVICRDAQARQYVSDVSHFLQSPWTAQPALDHLFSEREILDDQLRMMFTCCHPMISSDSQIALMLKTLCGFSVSEIARAFVTHAANINKRLVRARKKIRTAGIPFEVPHGHALNDRLKVVLEAIYLLFNEGYNATTGDAPIRRALSNEAMRLTEIVIRHEAIENKSSAHALLALMQFNAARFDARIDEEGCIRTLEQQDRSRWDRDLIREGLQNLSATTRYPDISTYHILASISSNHCLSPDFESTPWSNILRLYDQLLEITDSPIVRLNRALVLGRIKGPEPALRELEVCANALDDYYLFHSSQADLYIRAKRFEDAANALRKAVDRTTLPAEKTLLTRRLADCLEKINSM